MAGIDTRCDDVNDTMSNMSGGTAAETATPIGTHRQLWSDCPTGGGAGSRLHNAAIAMIARPDRYRKSVTGYEPSGSRR